MYVGRPGLRICCCWSTSFAPGLGRGRGEGGPVTPVVGSCEVDSCGRERESGETVAMSGGAYREGCLLSRRDEH